jgi:hypothetical protein
MPKQNKTASELQGLIMQEIRKHQNWSHVHGVAIVSKIRSVSHHANWDVQFVMEDNRLIPGEVFHLITHLQNQYDLR